MNCYDFEFSPSYSGRWRVFDRDANECWGKLYISHDGIKLDVMYKDQASSIQKKTPIIKGYAYSEDSGKKKSEQYNFILWNASFLSSTSYLNELNHSEYDIESIIIYKDSFDLDNIKSVCLRTDLLGTWCDNLMFNGFNKKEFDWESNHVQIDYKPQSVFELFKDEERFCFIHFGDKYIESRDLVGIQLKSFFNLFFKSTISLSEAYTEIYKYIYLFFFLWNSPFVPDFLEFRSEKGNFIYKVSNRHSYQYDGLYKTDKVFSNISTLPNFTSQQLHAIYEKWIALYEEYGDSIDTYCETLSNGHHSPSVQIKNYISSLDGLTKNIVGDRTECHQKSKRHILYDNIIKATGKTLSSDIKQQLKNALIHEKGSELKPRLKKLIKGLSLLLPQDINEEFVEKAVNTRNNLTHPKEKEDFSFPFQEYDYLTFSLTKIIRAHVLKTIGFPIDEAKMFLEY